MSNRNGPQRQYGQSLQSAENARLRRAYDMLPKTAHAEFLMERHDDIRPEWVMRIIEDPYDQWVETDNHGRTSQVIAGRIEGASQWIRVVLNLDGELVTAHFDHRLAAKFGGRPWPQNQ